LLPITPELPGDDELIPGRIVEVDERTVWPFFAVAQVLVERDALGDDDVDALAGSRSGLVGLGSLVTVRTALARLSSDSQRVQAFERAASRLLSTTSLNDSRSASRTSGGT